MKTWLSNPAAIRAAGTAALDAGQETCVLRTRMAARLPSGIKTSDAVITTKIEVTFGERAAGAMRGESRQDIAGRETSDAALAAGFALSQMVEAAALRACKLRAEAEKIVASVSADGASRKPWRVRGLAIEIRDLLDDHDGSGVRAILAETPKDVQAIEAWLPVAPPEDLRVDGLSERTLSHLKGGAPDQAIALLTQARDAIKGVCTRSFEVWGDPLASDIALLTTDVHIRHLLTQAMDLRDRAAEFATKDPEKAAEIIASALSIEDEALEALQADGTNEDLGALLDSRDALQTQAGMRFK